MTTARTKLATLAISNLQRKARDYCDAIDALLELDIQPSDDQVRRLLATLQDAETTARELTDRLRALCVDSGWLERMSESRRTDKRERLPTNPALDHTVPMPEVKK